MTVDEYLAGAPEPQRSTLGIVRETLRVLLPQGEEGLSYGVPVVRVDGKPVAGFAYFARHCSYFPHSGSVLAQVSDELTGYRWSKGTLQFPIDRPLPESLVALLVSTRLADLNLQ